MSTQPRFYPDAHDSHRFYYIPGEPVPERGPNGKPTLRLWVNDHGARLQFGSQWALHRRALAALQRAITARFPQVAPGEIDLQPAPARVDQVELLLGEEGDMVPLSVSTSSGFVPFTALFAVSLDAGQKAGVLAALHGRTGFLAVRYLIDVQQEDGGWSRVERTADIGEWFADGSGSDHITVLPGSSIRYEGQGGSGCS